MKALFVFLGLSLRIKKIQIEKKKKPLWYLTFFLFLAVLNGLSRNNSSGAVLPEKSLKSPWTIGS